MDDDYIIQDEETLRDLFPPTHDLAVRKCLDHFDRHSRDFIALSPFLCLGTHSPDGSADVSPRGDAPGFVRVVDERTCLVPDRPGNNRLDTLVNVVRNPSVGILFLIPGFDDTLRVNGTAVVTRDPAKLIDLAVQGRPPTVALEVVVGEVFLHCAKALRRAKLWDPGHFQDRARLPSLPKIIRDQTQSPPMSSDAMRALEAELEAEYKATMY